MAIKNWTILLLLIVGLTSLAWGQVVGASLSGTVTDDSGAGMPKAAVTITNLETGAERQLVTDEAGRYSAPSIPVGPYQVSAEKAGFSTQVKTGINLVVGQKTTVDLMLPVGELKQVVTIEEAAAVVSVSNQAMSGVVNERQVKDLPLNGRSYDGLMALNPSVVNYTSQRSGGTGTSNSALGNMFAVSGRRPQENLYLLNGIEYTGASEINVTPGGASGQLLGVDAVREFNVVVGYLWGGIRKASRGSGKHHYLVRNQSTAWNPLRIPAQQRSGRAQFLRSGPDSAISAQRVRRGVGRTDREEQNLRLRKFRRIPPTPGVERRHPGSRHPARLGYLPNSAGVLKNVGLAPGVAALFALWPVQNGPDLGSGIGVAFSHPLQTIREDFGTARFDYYLSSKDTLAAVYTVDDSADNTPSVNPLSSAIETLREQVVSLQEQHIFSPTLLNTARIGFSRASFFFDGETPANLPGWVPGNPIGAVVIGGGTALNGASQISLAGTNAGSNLSATRNLFTLDDHIMWTHGIHTIEAGVWLQRIQANDNLAQYQNGQASFGSLASFLAGTISTFTVVPSPTALGWRSLEGAGFVQDAIKLRPNLELRVGFRFESTNGWNEVHGRASNYVFDASGIIQTNPVVGNSVFTVNRAKFLPEPRVGLAWDPFGKSKTVIRAGFGIYRALLDNIDYRMDQTAPYNTTQSFKNIQLSDLNIVPGAAAPAGSKISPSGIQPDAYTPTVISWTFKIEQEIAHNTSFGIGYVGSHGYHEMLSLDANIPIPTLVGGTIFFPKTAPLANPKLANTTTWFSEGLSSYNALQLDLNRRFSQGFQLRGVYTFSKSLDDGTAWNSSVGANSPGFVMYPLNPKLDWGPSNSDIRNLAVINGSYELPLGNGKRFLHSSSGWGQKLAGGWSLSGILSLQSGFPFTPSLGFNPSNDGDSRNPVRPSLNPAFTGNVIQGGPNQYFNPNAFIIPPAGTYGNLGRNTYTGPGLAELDLSVLKNTAISERIHLQFRAELFNVLNRANFGTPNTVVFASATPTPSPTAGVITSTSSTSRQIQFGLKLLW